ncbi:hypothetical protein CFSAN002075_22688, partial [Salmonella enterica subsp. enterica serovar Heidelberg str. CFSAN002075]
QRYHEVVLATNSLIHHKRILRAKRKDHGGAKGKPLKIIRYHVNYPELFFLKADYSAGILLA